MANVCYLCSRMLKPPCRSTIVVAEALRCGSSDEGVVEGSMRRQQTVEANVGCVPAKLLDQGIAWVQCNGAQAKGTAAANEGHEGHEIDESDEIDEGDEGHEGKCSEGSVLPLLYKKGCATVWSHNAAGLQAREDLGVPVRPLALAVRACAGT